jgi:hypothetical protein
VTLALPTNGELALAKITGSKIDLAMHCVHWTTVKLPEDRTGRSAEIMGNPFHDAVASGASEPLADDHEEWLTQERLRGWLEKGRPLLPATYREEVAFRIAPDGSSKFLGQHIDRNYGEGVGINLTVDVVGADVVIDHKTGKRLRPAAVAWQLRAGNVATGTHQRAFHYIAADGAVTPDEYTASDAELEADRRRLVVLMADVLEGRTAPVPGAHCRDLYCPARKTCDAHATHEKAKEKTMGRMTLKNTTKGRIESPFAVLIYGPEGVGKSSFANDAPAPMFLDPDGGTGEIEIHGRFPKPDSWQECLEAIETLQGEKHEYKTFVTDTADALEALIHREVCRAGGKHGIEDFGYGKGYTAALDLWRVYLAKLDALRAKGMHIVVVAHSTVKTFQNPAGDDYDRFRLKLHDKSAALIKEWASAVLFVNYKTYTHEKDGKVRALGDGSRVVYTEHRPAWDAKNRYGLPYEMPLAWAEFERCARAGEPIAVEQLLDDVAKLRAQCDDATQAQAAESLKRCGKDVRKLAMLADWLRGKVQTATSTEAA